MKVFKIDRENDITVGSIIKSKVNGQLIIGEVINILTDIKERYEIIQYDKRLRPLFRGDQSYKRRLITASKCKLLDINFKFDTSNDFELGDIVLLKRGVRKKYGVIIGFHHPDGLMSRSFEFGYNGTDIIDCVEINNRTLQRKRKLTGELKRFETTGDKLIRCEVDLWHRTGPKILS